MSFTSRYCFNQFWMIKPLKVGQFHFQQTGQTISEKITVLWASIIYEAIPKILISFSWKKMEFEIYYVQTSKACVYVLRFSSLGGIHKLRLRLRGWVKNLSMRGRVKKSDKICISWRSNFIEISENILAVWMQSQGNFLCITLLLGGDIKNRLYKSK